MGDDEFVGGENGEGKRLVVFFWLWICGEAGRGLVGAWWWFASLRCGAGAAEGARGGIGHERRESRRVARG